MYPIDFRLTREPFYDHYGACMWRSSLELRSPWHLRSCCGRVTARPARPRTEPSPTCRDGPPSALSNSAPYCAATNSLRAAEAVEIARALPHGHVLAALGTARRLALDAVIAARPGAATSAGSGVALIVARLLEPEDEAGDRADAGFRHRQPFAGRDAGARQGRRQGSSMLRSTGWAASSRSSKPSWPVATCRMARCCSTTSPRPISKGGAANWRSMATAATTGVTGRKLSSA